MVSKKTKQLHLQFASMPQHIITKWHNDIAKQCFEILKHSDLKDDSQQLAFRKKYRYKIYHPL